MVIAPASTGRDKRRSTAVIKVAQANRGMECIRSPTERMFTIVVMKFRAETSEDVPARWRLKMARSTEAPLCPLDAERSG